MSMDFSAYNVEGTITAHATGYAAINKPYSTLRNMYNTWGGFNKPIPTDFAYSATQRYFAGRYITSFSPKLMKKFDSADSLYNVQFSPFVTSSPLVYSSFGRTQWGYSAAMYNGYNSTRRTITTPPANDAYACTSVYANFQRDLEPRRIRIITPNEQITDFVTGRAKYLITVATEILDQNNWSISNPAQWTETNTFQNFLKHCTWVYDCREVFSTTKPEKADIAYSGTGGDFGRTAQFVVFRSVDDRSFYSGLGCAITQTFYTPISSFEFDKTTGNFTAGGYDCFDTTISEYYWTAMTTYGRYPSFNLKYQDFVNHFNLIGSDSAAGKALFFIRGKWWHVDDGKFLDENGIEMTDTNDDNLEMGGFVVNCLNDNTTTYSCNIIPICHLSNFFQVVASAGVPFSYPSIAPESYGLFEERYTGVAAWYQAPVNNQGIVNSDYKPLSKDPKYFQGIVDPSEIIIAPPESDPIDETPLEIPSAFYISAGCNMYAIDQGSLNTLTTNLFEVPTTLRDIIDKYSSTLAESVKSVLVFPFSIPKVSATLASSVNFHGETLLQNAAIIRQATTIFDMGNTVVPSTGSYRDYKPYTRMFMYLPYCGFTEIDPKDIVGKKISVQYAIDLQTGDCKACIFRGSADSAGMGVLIKTESGNIGIPIPLTCRDFTSYINGLVSAGVNAGGAVGAAITGNALPAIMAGANVVNTLEKLSQSTIEQKGITATAAAFTMPQYPFVIRVSAKSIDYAGFAHEKGIACLKTGKFTDFTGFTVFQNVDLSGVPLTAGELATLKNLLETGVYM